MSNEIPVPTWGPSVTSFFTKQQAELIYVEQMVPSHDDKTNVYWSGCDFYFDKRIGYAGIQHQKDKIIGQVPFIYNNICSIWDLKDTEPSLPAEVTLTYGLKGLHSSHFGGDGTGLHTSHPMPWFPNQWYATVIRRWYIRGENVTRMAMFMFSYLDNKWTHYMSAAVPGIDIPLSGKTCTGFLERFGGNELKYSGVYGQHFRMHKNGSWEKPLYYQAAAGGDSKYWNAELYQGVNIKLSTGGVFDNTQSTIILKPKQCDSKPKSVRFPAVEALSASYNKDKHAMTVNWEIAGNSTPQLSHNIKVRKNSLSGPLVAGNSDSVPEKRKTVFQVKALERGKYYMTFRFQDIFNQKSDLNYIVIYVD